LSRSRAGRFRALAALLGSLLALGSTGCLQLIAPYDDQTVRDIFAAARAVDQFYGELLEAPAGKRQYALFSERYVRIESELRSLVLRNEVRPLNEDSTEIARNILALWQQKKERHMKTDSYQTGAANLDRERFADLFKYAVMAEKGKPGGGEDDRATDWILNRTPGSPRSMLRKWIAPIALSTFDRPSP
jgi:hypothetical protein